MSECPTLSGRLCWSGRVEPDDIDENGHMNVRTYDRVLEEAGTDFFYAMGWTPDYPRLQRRGFFRLESHLRYESELFEGDPLAVTVWLAGRDARRFHFFLQLWQAETRRRAATMDTMMIHMDLKTRRPFALEDPVQCRAWDALEAEQAGCRPPQGIGRRVTMHRQ